jgi:hypothetical protein
MRPGGRPVRGVTNTTHNPPRTAYGGAAPGAILTIVTPTPPGVAIGQPAPRFSLTSLQGATVDLADYQGRQNVVVWFSRGFTCPFCLIDKQGIVRHRLVVGPVAPVPGGAELAALTRTHCPDDPPGGGNAVPSSAGSAAAAR